MRERETKYRCIKLKLANINLSIYLYTNFISLYPTFILLIECHGAPTAGLGDFHGHFVVLGPGMLKQWGCRGSPMAHQYLPFIGHHIAIAERSQTSNNMGR